jgi:K+-transporting ATPase KdpF subunit
LAGKKITIEMKVKTLASVVTAAIPSETHTAIPNNPAGYIIGGIIALLIMGYLIYTLIYPDRF